MSVYSEVKPKNKARKNPFPLGCHSKFNTKCGLIVPAKFWPTLPNSEYELDLKCLLRTQPLSTAAFAGFSINYDVVWTPYNDHYSSFNQFIAQRLNKQHTTQPDINEIPNFDLASFVKTMIALSFYDYFGAEVTDDEKVRIIVERMPQVPLQTFVSENLPEQSMPLGCIRMLDMLEYGNYLPLIKQACARFRSYVKDAWSSQDHLEEYPTVILLCAYLEILAGNSAVGTIYTADGVGVKKGDVEILDLSEIDPSSFDIDAIGQRLYEMLFLTSSSNAVDMFRFRSGFTYANVIGNLGYKSLWPVFCYNKAFWQFYRNEYYDINYKFYEFGNSADSFEYVQLFNYDDFNGSIDSEPSDYTTYSRLMAMFAVKPHQYKKDLFTGLLPSTQYGSVSVASADDVFAKLIGNNISSSVSLDANQVYTSFSDGPGPTAKNLNQTLQSASYQPKSDKYKFDPAPMINVLELRKADALQRFRERMLRAGNKTKDIFQAHGWEEPMSEKAFDVQFFGNFDGRLDINVVASTTQTENVDLGQLAANGVSVISGGKVRFKSHDFGSLVLLLYITKDAIYDAYGCHKSHSLLEAFDFPYPELQNISLAPITKDLLNVYDSSPNTDILGYLPQNMVYKTSNDLVHGEFYTADPTGRFTWSLPSQGIFANMVTPRLDIGKPKSLSFFYVQPSCADNIFVVNANGNQDTDQFFGDVYFDLYAVQPLDVIGLPI